MRASINYVDCIYIYLLQLSLFTLTWVHYLLLRHAQNSRGFIGKTTELPLLLVLVPFFAPTLRSNALRRIDQAAKDLECHVKTVKERMKDVKESMA